MPLRSPERIHPTLRKLLLVTAGAVLTLAGLAGVLIPILPGLPLLAGAVLCFSMVSPTFKQRVGVHLFRQPRYRLARRRWNAGAGLPLLPRIRLALWTSLAALTPSQPSRPN